MTDFPKPAMAHARITELDGLRGVAVAVVVLSHYMGGIVPGGFGVTLFFVVSGYIITRLFLAELEKTGTVAVGRFYLRRFLRLTPALAVSVAVVSGLALAFGPGFSMVPVAASLVYLKNYQTLFLPDFIGPPLAYLGITWSLAVEQHFYLAFPLLFVMCRTRPRLFVWLLAALLAGALAWRFVLVLQFEAPWQYTYMASDTRFDSPLTGALLACLCARIERRTGRPPRASAWHLLGGVVLVAATLAWRDPVFRETLRYSIQNAGSALIIFGALHGKGLLLIRRSLSSGPLHQLGIISYSVYLWQFIALDIAERTVPAALSMLVIPVAFVLLIISATLSWYFLERSTEHLRRLFAAGEARRSQLAMPAWPALRSGSPRPSGPVPRRSA